MSSLAPYVPVGGGAGEESPVLHARLADVEVGDDVAVHRHVLPDQVPAETHTRTERMKKSQKILTQKKKKLLL